MTSPAETTMSEEQLAEFVNGIAADSARHHLLADLLREDHHVYNQRSAAAIVRMRGWILLALARTGVSDRELPFILEEFDTGTEAYLISAAARALRSYPHPGPSFTPYILHALANVRDEPLSFETYGEYATSSTGTTAAGELLATLTWLGAHARAALPELAALRAQPGHLSRHLRAEFGRTIASIRKDLQNDHSEKDVCCSLTRSLGQQWRFFGGRTPLPSLGSIVFEDQDGSTFRFHDFFHGKPSIVVFFYTRCDNPWKCSLTVTKLARIQQLLRERGLAGGIRTAAITYDPAFDLPRRLRAYGTERGVQFDDNHRIMRAAEGADALRQYFRLGVNFIESLVNRHRIELYILDAESRVALSFERIRWDEAQVVYRAAEVLRKKPAPAHTEATAFGALISLACAFMPKCPMCWAAYFSVFGMEGMLNTPYFSKMQPLLLVLLLINVLSVWLRTNRTRRRSGFYLVCAADLLIMLAYTKGWDAAAVGGIALSLFGSIWAAVDGRLPACFARPMSETGSPRASKPSPRKTWSRTRTLSN